MWHTVGPGRPDALDLYDEAVAAVCAGADPIPALRRAVEADPTYGVAVADLTALTGGPVPDPLPTTSRWERQHVEIVRAAAADVARAEALLREHTGVYSCDPIALLVVARRLGGIDSSRLTDLRGTSCTCWT